MKYNHLILLVTCFYFSILPSQSQNLRLTYPVQVNAFINPPYSLKPEDYYNPAKPKLSITLLNRDLMEPLVNVKLHFSIKAGNGVRLETKDHVSYPVIQLQSGTPYLLTQNDLSPYLQYENLNIQGILPNGQFPEGMIEFCVFVIEVQTNKIISQNSCARAWIALNRPPILNLPQKGISLPFQEAQNILFQWTPRHQNLSDVEYKFILKEIWDENIAPEAGFLYSPEIYSTTIRTTALPYTVMMPTLMESKRYAWQVQAIAKDGADELSLFENNGFSEIYTFSIAQSCYAPQNIRHSQDRDHLVIEWTPEPNAEISLVAYRLKNSGNEWVVIKGNQDYARIFDLAFDIEYEYKVGTVCSDGSITYSEIYTAILENWKEKFKISCGMIPSFDKSNFDPLAKLNPADVFIAGDFPVTVIESKGSNGVFTGTGWTTLPLFGFVKIAVRFSGVKINKEYQLVDGSIEASYDKDEKLIADLDRLWHGGSETGFTKTGAVESKVKANFSIPNEATAEYDADSGNLVINDKDGNAVGTVKIPEEDREIFTSGNPYTYIVEDSDGNIVVFTKDEDGKTSSEQIGKNDKPLTEGSFSETTIATQKAVVEFLEGDNSSYSFDTWQDYYKTVSLIVNKNTYEFIGTYPVACQLIPSGKSEYVRFKVNKTDKKLNEDSIIFRTKAGYSIEPKDGQLHIAGGKENDAQDLFALYPDGKGGYLTLGKLKILSYPEKTFNVRLIPVNENYVDSHEIGEYLNAVYGKVGIQWNVESDSSFTYPDIDLHSEGSSFFSRYTDEMKEMNTAYRISRGSLDKNTAYIFILNEGSINGQSMMGDMPRGKQFGYVFTQSGGDINRTIAHELGHGMFKLRHTFDGEYGSTAQSLEGKTNNLMDYGEGTHFAKWQWDEIHDPAWLVNPFESDEDGMAKSGNERVLEFLRDTKSSIQKGSSFKIFASLLETNSDGVYIGSQKYQSIKIRISEIEKTVKQPKLVKNTSIDGWGNTIYLILFEDIGVRIMLETEKEQLALLAYLGQNKAGSISLFVSGYNWQSEFWEFINPNSSYTKDLPESKLDAINFVRKDISEVDIMDYWDDFSKNMAGLLKSKESFYVTGHDNIGTSNHKTIGLFAASCVSSYNTLIPFIIVKGIPLPNPCYHSAPCVELNNAPNVNGFNTRRSNGRLSGKEFVKELSISCSKNDSGIVQDTLDIICHSMGFAHALGIIDEVKNAMKSELKGLTLGRLYIFAPENPSCGEVNTAEWEDVWQYGSREDKLKDQPWLLDGVAPQCPVGGIDGKRAYIPSDVSQGFLKSHFISNYGWVFELKVIEDGYIKPRK
ncbi:MAG: hypothetical protein LBJ72_05045 [Dysgonamonadaceae bacterium]|jgi:hypothetical protein|nr:hypothetical protein [Dysgonamonadaceae bacterium]